MLQQSIQSAELSGTNQWVASVSSVLNFMSREGETKSGKNLTEEELKKQEEGKAQRIEVIFFHLIYPSVDVIIAVLCRHALIVLLKIVQQLVFCFAMFIWKLFANTLFERSRDFVLLFIPECC